MRTLTRFLRRLRCWLAGHRYPVFVRADIETNVLLLIDPVRIVECARCGSAATARARVVYRDGLHYVEVKVEAR